LRGYLPYAHKYSTLFILYKMKTDWEFWADTGIYSDFSPHFDFWSRLLNKYSNGCFKPCLHPYPS